jgi:hypothetical protein
MASSKTFNGVTQAVFDCVKARSSQEHGTAYEPAGALSGVASTKTIVGTVKLKYEFDPAKQQISYKIESKPLVAPESSIWDGISSTISACGGKT